MRRKKVIFVLLALYVGILGGRYEVVGVALEGVGISSLVKGGDRTALINSIDRDRDVNEGGERGVRITDEPERITVVGTVDGLLHGFDQNNNKKWTTDIGGGPLSSHHSSGLLDYNVIPATDGSLLLICYSDYSLSSLIYVSVYIYPVD